MWYLPVFPAINREAFDYFDVVVLGVLIFGLFRGRKHGMSQELLPTLQWLGIIIVAGLFYRPFAVMIHQNTALSHLWANISAYVLIGIGVHLVFLGIKRASGEKLVGSDLFGGKEYYLGMCSGVVRYGCILVAFCALMHAKIVSKAELAAEEKMQKQNFEDIRFPTFGTLQQAVLVQSFTGKVVTTNLNGIMIRSAEPDKRKIENLARRREELVNEVIGPIKR